MADPFRSNSKSQLFREAQIGLSVVAVLLVILVYVAFYRITGRGRQIPEHVRNAPVAQTAWPNALSPHVAAQKISPSLGQGTAPNHKLVDGAVGAHIPEPIENRPVTTMNQDKTNFLKESKSKPSRFGSNRASRMFENSSVSPMVQTQTSDPSNVLNRPKRTQPIPNHEWSDPPLKSIESVPKQSPTEKNGFQIPRPDTQVMERPMKVANRENSNPSNQAASDGFDNRLRSSIFHLPNQQDSAMQAHAKVPVNEFPTQPVSASSAIINDTENPAAKTTDNARTEAEPLKLLSSDFDSNQFNPTYPSAAKKDETQESNLMPTREMTQTLPTNPIHSDTEPMVSVLGSVVGVPDEVSEKEVKPVYKPQDDANVGQLQPSGQPMLIPAKPIPFVNDLGFAKPLSQAENHSSRAGKTDIASPVQETDPIQNAFAEETTPPSQSHIVQAGDSFWSIAEQVYGDGRYFRALFKYNQPTHPNFDSMTEGASIGTPSQEDLQKLFPNSCPADESGDVATEFEANSSAASRFYVTHEGDTLFEIARQELGQASRYLEIKELNRFGLDSQVSHLTPLRRGVRLVMPFEPVR